MRYTAPADVTSAFLSSGPIAVVDGAIEVPDDAPVGDLKGLAANGFVAAATQVLEPIPATSEPDPAPIVEHEEQ